MRLGQVLGHASRTKERIACFFPRILFGVPAAGQLGRARRPGTESPKGLLCDARWCWVRRVPCETSHTHTHTHTRIYAQTHTHTYSLLLTPTQTPTYIRVWHGWPLAEEPAKAGREVWEPGTTLQLVAAGVASVSRNRSGKFKDCCIRLSGCQSRHLEPFFHTLGKQKRPPVKEPGWSSLCACVHVCV